MRKLIILFLISSAISAQSIKSTFNVRYKNVDDNILESENNNLPKKVFSYEYSKNTSIYKLIDINEFKANDSIKSKDSDKMIPSITITSSKELIFKNLLYKNYLMEYTLYDTNFSIKDNLQNFEWELSDEVKLIKGYKCKKAISKKEKSKITAWYCEDIPINDGPNRFYGLPGFILKVEIGEFSIIEIDQFKLFDENIKIEAPLNKSKYITMDEFEKEEIDLFNKKANED